MDPLSNSACAAGFRGVLSSVATSPKFFADHHYNPFAYDDLHIRAAHHLASVANDVINQSAAEPSMHYGAVALEAAPYTMYNVGGTGIAGNHATGFEPFMNETQNAAVPSTTACLGYRGSAGYLARNYSTDFVPPAAAVARTPSFRRTPGARRPLNGATSASTEVLSSTSSERFGSGSHSMALAPRPLFPGLNFNQRSGTAGGMESYSPSVARAGRRFPSDPYTTTCARQIGGRHITAAAVGIASIAGRGVELVVSNLDYNISLHEWKLILQSEFQQQVQILAINMQMQQDNTSIGFVRVASMEDARHAIAQFHRKKIGYKRIHVTLNETSSSASIKAEVVGLMRTAHSNVMPLYQFVDSFEKRFGRGISIAELYHMRDVVAITDREGIGKVVTLASPGHNEPLSSVSHLGDEVCDVIEPPLCRHHVTQDERMDAAKNSPFMVVLQLRTFSTQVHILLQSHEGSLPLASFPNCYAAEFEPLSFVPHSGVPLEHLISCISGVRFVTTKSGVKKIQWSENRTGFGTYETSDRFDGTTSTLSTAVVQFSHDVVDLLRHSPKCLISFSRFSNQYYQHFGRHFRITDYAFPKLVDLFDAIPHVVQVIGRGADTYVTLAHKAQVKRFTADILKVVKSQASREISVTDLPVQYYKLTGRTFDITEYGLCFVDDMLSEMTDTAITITGTGPDATLSLTRRDQTLEEIERTRQFAVDAVDLLKHCPQYRLAFSRFIPSFHRHFARQCRVSDYGFTKLIELLEANPHVIRIVEDETEKQICLTESELIKILEDNVAALLKSFPSRKVSLVDFFHVYSTVHGQYLRLDDFGVSTVAELIAKIPNVAKVEVSADGRRMISVVDNEEIQTLACNVLLLLMDRSDGTLPFSNLSDLYRQKFGGVLSVDHVANDLRGVVQVTQQPQQPQQQKPLDDDARNTADTSAAVVKLSAVQMFARDARAMLLQRGGGASRLALSSFDDAYQQHFGVNLAPASYGFPSLAALIQAVPLVLVLRGKAFHQRLVMLTPRFQEKLTSIPSVMTTTETSTEARRSSSSHNFSPVEDIVPINDRETTTFRNNSTRFSPVCEQLMLAAKFLPAVTVDQAESSRTETRDETDGVNSIRSRRQIIYHRQQQQHPQKRAKPQSGATGDFTSHSIEQRLLVGTPSQRLRSTSSAAGCEEVELCHDDVTSPPAYPPMPASAQHISVVQDLIINGSSPRVSCADSSTAAWAGSATEFNAVFGSTLCSIFNEQDAAPATPETARDRYSQLLQPARVPDFESSAFGVSSSQNRLSTPRRSSRVVARLGLLPAADGSEATPESRPIH